MSATARTVLFWLLVAAAALGAVYVLRDVLAPFFAGLALAYLFHPLARRLEAWGLPRSAAAVVVLLIVVLAAVALVLTLWPVVQAQLVRLLDAIPQYWQRLQQDVVPALIERLDARLPTDMAPLAEQLSNYSSTAASWLAGTLKDLLGQGLALFSLVTLIVVTPIVTFYLLRDWRILLDVLDGLLPRQHLATIRMLARDIDHRVAGFIRGQVIIALSLGVFYAVGLMLIGLKFAFTVGLVSGLISLIPFVGTITGVLLALVLAIVQFGDWLQPLLVLGVFGLGQFLEGNILQPWLLGDRVGLHPVWVIFALLAGGSLAGLTGMLLAVPAMAAIAVLLRFGVDRYRASTVYTGGDRAA